MALDLDQFPIYDKISDQYGFLMPVWLAALSSFQQTLSEYISQNGIAPPKLTTAQRDAIKNPDNVIIYNIDIHRFQGYENGSWVNLS